MSVAIPAFQRRCIWSVATASAFVSSKPGRNSGFVGRSSSKLGMSAMIARFGEEETRHYYRNGLAAIDLVRDPAVSEAIDCEACGDGELGIAHRSSQMAGMVDWAQTWRTILGVEVDVWSREELAERGCAGPYARGGLFTHAGFAPHPMKYARGLARACMRHGVGFHGRSEVTAWHRDGGVAPMCSTA